MKIVNKTYLFVDLEEKNLLKTSLFMQGITGLVGILNAAYYVNLAKRKIVPFVTINWKIVLVEFCYSNQAGIQLLANYNYLLIISWKQKGKILKKYIQFWVQKRIKKLNSKTLMNLMYLTKNVYIINLLI